MSESSCKAPSTHDPSRTLANKFAVMHNAAISYNDVVPCNPRNEGSTCSGREFIALPIVFIVGFEPVEAARHED